MSFAPIDILMTDMTSEKSSSNEQKFRRALEVAIHDFGIDALTDKQIDQLTAHYSMLCRWNQKINLTRITDAEEAARLHYAESLLGAQIAHSARNIIDLGSGAGFPAIPLTVVCMKSHITAIEANQKKSLFLEEVKDELRLDNFSVAQNRLEEFDLSHYDLLTSRAIDRAEDVMPKVIKALSDNQQLMLYCGPDLLEILQRQFASKFTIKIISIPRMEARMIVIFSRI